MSKHTPGPWSTWWNDEEGLHVLNPYDIIVCEQVHTEEDAALITAAPEMYEALKEFLHIWRYGGEGINVRALMDRVRAVVARVEGRDHV